MEVQGSTRALDVFNFLNGKFTFGGSAEHTRGFRMIFGIVIAIKATCVEFIPKMYTGVVDQFVMGCSPHSFFRKILGGKKNLNSLINIFKGLFLPFLLFMFLFHLHISKGVLPYLKSGKEIWTVKINMIFIKENRCCILVS